MSTIGFLNPMRRRGRRQVTVAGVLVALMVPVGLTLAATSAVAATAPAGPVVRVNAVAHRNATLLAWPTVTGAAAYEVSRDGIVLGSSRTESFLDSTTSAGQTYTYAVATVSPDGRRAAKTSIEVQNRMEPGDRAWVSTTAGPALCGGTGNSSSQNLVCTVRNGAAFVKYTSASGTWNFSVNQAWVPSPDGVEYCTLIGAPPNSKVKCTTFTGTGFSASTTSTNTDWGYVENRAWVSTGVGPALCGRAGTTTNQVLTCTVRTPGGFVHYYSPAGDWGYAANRSWVPSGGGVVDYCGLVGTPPSASKVRCTTFTGAGFDPATVSGVTDWGFASDRNWVSTGDGPALCGRAGSTGNQVLTCTVRSGGVFVRHTSTAGDWGYAANRAWVPSPGGGVDYCGLIGTAPSSAKVRCTTFTGSTFTASVVSANTDWGYAENRAWVSTGTGPALCGRAGSTANQVLTCTVRNGATFSHLYSPAGDWGYGVNRSWVPSPGGGADNCVLVGTPPSASKVRCTTFTGTGFDPATVSGDTDWGFPDVVAV